MPFGVSVFLRAFPLNHPDLAESHPFDDTFAEKLTDAGIHASDDFRRYRRGDVLRHAGILPPTEIISRIPVDITTGDGNIYLDETGE